MPPPPEFSSSNRAKLGDRIPSPRGTPNVKVHAGRRPLFSEAREAPTEPCQATPSGPIR